MKNIINLNNIDLTPNDNAFSTNYTIRINDELYYVKKSNSSHKELVISTFCRLLGIPCVDYMLARQDNNYYIISKSYKKPNCRYISGVNLLISFFNNTSEEELKDLHMKDLHDGKENNLETIWLSLENKYYYSKTKYQDIRKVMVELLKQYFLMILIQDSDFHSLNWEIEESKDHIALAPKYDNESAFGLEILGVPMGASADDPFEETIKSINHFLSITASSDNQIFLDMFYKATPETFKEAIKIVKDLYGIDKLDDEDFMINRYEQHYNELSNLLKEKGLAR